MSNNVNVDNTIQNASITISVKQLIVALGVILSSLAGTYVKITSDIEASKTEIKNDINRLDDQNREDTKALGTQINSLIKLHMNASVPTQPAPTFNNTPPAN
jgi:hypothetical protein